MSEWVWIIVIGAIAIAVILWLWSARIHYKADEAQFHHLLRGVGESVCPKCGEEL